MDPTKASLDAPPSYEETASETRHRSPVTLILDDQTIHLNDETSTPLYRLSRSVTALQQESSSIQLDSVERNTPEKPESRGTHLFYLVHPVNARYRTDKPAYYATSNPATAGSNFILLPPRSKNPLQKPEFTVLVSPDRTAASDVLFANAKEEQTLFTAKKKWTGDRCVWRNASGREIAVDEGVANEGKGTRKLMITESLDQVTSHALVAAWCLRSWHDVAESKEAIWNSA